MQKITFDQHLGNICCLNVDMKIRIFLTFLSKKHESSIFTEYSRPIEYSTGLEIFFSELHFR